MLNLLASENMLKEETLYKEDSFYMEQALILAQQGSKSGEVPVGAVVVTAEGEVVGTGANETEQRHSQLFHAEAMAIAHAGTQQKDWRLDRCTLYVTLEPCMMCVSLCALSRIERIVYGADSPLFGYHLDREGVLSLYTKQIKNITKGLMAERSVALLQDFFSKQRKK
jgi:tRNA(adenine34) deaminase